MLRLPPARSRPICWPSPPGMPACRAPSGPWNRFHDGRSPPPSLIPGAHQVPARTMGGLCGRLEGCGCSCENFLREAARMVPLLTGRESDSNGLGGGFAGQENRQLRMTGRNLSTRLRQSCRSRADLRSELPPLRPLRGHLSPASRGRGTQILKLQAKAAKQRFPPARREAVCEATGKRASRPIPLARQREDRGARPARSLPRAW